MISVGTVVGDIENLVNPFMRVISLMTTHLATLSESKLLPYPRLEFLHFHIKSTRADITLCGVWRVVGWWVCEYCRRGREEAGREGKKLSNKFGV